MATIPSIQKALTLYAEGGKYSVADAPVPHPGPKEVLVKVVAAALDPIDWKITIPPFSSFITEFPFITGSDGAGIVVQVGEDVTSLKEGDRIVFQGWFRNPYGTLQQYCIVSADLAALIPENISFEQASSIPLGLATVILALYNQHPDWPKTLRFKPVWEEGGSTEFAGKPALVIGGASSVGQYAIQVAKLAGFSPIITTASPRNTDLLTSLGATHVVDRSLPSETVLAKLPELTGGKPLEFAFDAISNSETMALAYQALAPGGALAIVLNDVIPKPLKVEPNEVELLPGGLAAAPEGLERPEQNKVSGKKLVVRPQETI
ncbi:GroES-like protein [Trametes polyzona]|nr:GroES-like protein [Trametes polyzona]